MPVRRLAVMRQRLPQAILVGLVLCVASAACAVGHTSGPRAAQGAGPLAHWVKFKHIPAVIDLASRGRGSLFVAAAGRLFTWRPGGAGDLLAATEASARTIVVRCSTTCTVRYIAAGPAISHAEGHIEFAR